MKLGVLDSSKNQTLVRMLRGDPEYLSPQLATGIPESHVTRDMFEGLVTEDADGYITPGQAELILAKEMPVAPVYWESNSFLIKPDLRGVGYNNSPLGRIFSREIYRVK